MISEQELVATLRAVDVADEPVDPDAWPALADPDSRREIERRLRAAGRQLVALRDPADADHPILGYLTGWDDATADAMLAAGGLDALSVAERAVLALVLLHSMAIPQSSGLAAPAGLRSAAPFDRTLLWDRPDAAKYGLGQTVVDSAVTTLRARGLLTRSLLPGPAFDRLGPEATHRLWRNLLVLARPSWARHLKPAQDAESTDEPADPSEALS